MLRGLLIAVLALAGIGLAGALAQEAAPDPEQIAYDIEHLPMINALNLTRHQIERLVPVLEAAVAERERILQEPPPAETVEALARLREALLRGELQEADVKAFRKQAGPAPGKAPATGELARLAAQLSEILTEEQIGRLVGSHAGRKQMPDGEKAVETTLFLLRRLPPAAYTARRERLAEGVAGQAQKPGTFEYEAARTGFLAELDRIREMADEDFERQRKQLAADFHQRWGSLAAGMDRRAPDKRAGKVREDPKLGLLEKLYAGDEAQYQQRRREAVEAAMEHRLAVEPNADRAQLRAQIIDALDRMRALTPFEFEDKKAALGEWLFGVEEAETRIAADPHAMAALNRLADERMIALLKAKLPYL